MSSEYENAKHALEGLLSWYECHASDRNEATTRLHIINRLLFTCLGWDERTDCVVEEQFAGKYTDYELLCPRRTVVVEAKKEGIYFEIPSGLCNRQYSIRTLVSDVPDLGQAITQAASYCQQRGAPFGVVTNGHQLVAFIGSRQDGLPPEDGRALVFSSLHAMSEDFPTLWSALSKPGVIERNLFKKLLGRDTPILPPKLSERIATYPGVKNRNIIQTELHILADLVFEDIISARELEDEFLRDCYCKSGALSQYALISKRLLSNRYAALFRNAGARPTLVAATTTKGISEELVAESFSKRPILIIGDVGVGKTMFFRHFIGVEAKEVFDDALVIYIDFGAQAALAKDVREFVVAEVARQLREEHGTDIYERSFVTAVYDSELQRFARGIHGGLRETDPQAYQRKEIEFLDQRISDCEQFLQDSLRHVSDGRRKQIVLVLDNADQRSDAVQQQVFVMAQTMAARWRAAVFLALRPETFQRSRVSGSLSAYHLKAFTISPPRIDEVIEKRLQFALGITRGRLPMSSLSPGVSVDLKKVGEFLSIVLHSILSEHEVVECLDNLSGGNVRLALEFVRGLVGSGHIDTKKILEIYEKSGRYVIRLHDFLRSITFGDAVYYDPASSPVENVFDVESLDPKEHFLSLALLQFAAREAQSARDHGFVDLGRAYDFAQGLGYVVPQIDWSLCRLWNKKLLERAGRLKPVAEDISASSIRITTVGAYHVTRLPELFVYHDAIVTDVPVLDEAYRVQINDVSGIEERLSRGEVFLEYLNGCFAHLDSSRSGVDWPRMCEQVRNNIAQIRTYNE